MKEFFRGWRRKVGVVTLVMACLLMCGWVRSRGQVDLVIFSFPNLNLTFLSCHHGVRLLPQRSLMISYGGSSPNYSVRLTFQNERIENTPGISWHSYMSDRLDIQDENNEVSTQNGFYSYGIVSIPLTIIATWLLVFSKPRQSKPQSHPEPNLETAA
jgi:hypothetical protein